MIPASELTRLRTYANGLLPHTANILRSTVTDDTYGGRSHTWATASSGVPCRVNAKLRAGTTEVDLGERLIEVASYAISFPVGTDIRPSDRIEVNGETLEVTDVPSGGSLTVTLVVGARKVE